MEIGFTTKWTHATVFYNVLRMNKAFILNFVIDLLTQKIAIKFIDAPCSAYLSIWEYLIFNISVLDFSFVQETSDGDGGIGSKIK